MLTLEELWQNLNRYYLANGNRSTERARAAVQHVLDHFGSGRDLSTIDYRALQEYAFLRLEHEAKPATVQYELRILHKGFVEMEKAGLARTPLFPSIKVENVREFFAEEEQVLQVLDYLTWNIRALVQFLALTGWRRGEGTGLRWPQVNFQTGWIQLTKEQSKNKKGRLFPFGDLPPLKKLLEQQARKTREYETRHSMVIPWVFFSIRGSFVGQRIGDFRKSWDRAAREAGIPWLHVHDLRRTAVRRLVRAGVERRFARELTGHKTEAIFERYNIVDERDLRMTMVRLWEHLAKRTSDIISDAPS